MSLPLLTFIFLLQTSRPPLESLLTQNLVILNSPHSILMLMASTSTPFMVMVGTMGGVATPIVLSANSIGALVTLLFDATIALIYPFKGTINQ